MLAALVFAWESQPARSQQKDSADTGGRIVFCAYNLKNWLSMARSGPGQTPVLSTKPEKEKQAVVDILAIIRPDILGLCEIGTKEDLADLQSLLREKGIALEHSEMAHGGDPERRLGLLSRFPIVERQSQTDLHYQMGAATLPMQRGILDAKVRVSPGFDLRCVGLHLKSMREVPEGDQALMRRNEAHLARVHLDKGFETSPDACVLLYGDFNEHRNEPAIEEIIGDRSNPGRMGEVQLKDGNGQVWTHFWDDADVYSRFDYFFASRRLLSQIDRQRSYIFTSRDVHQASDHRPIVLSIRIPKQANP